MEHKIPTSQGPIEFTSAELFVAFDYAATAVMSGGRSAVNSERQQAILLEALEKPEEAALLAEMVIHWRNRTPPPD